MPFVKICGVTRPQDAVIAAEHGASAVGLVFWPSSPRAIDLAAARAIVRELPPFVAVVGVFVNEAPARVLEIAAAVPLTVVQFHGDEADEEVAACPWRVLRAVSPDSAEGLARLARLPRHVTVLLDAHDPRRRGGTGRAVSWAAAAEAARQRRIVLAGGLRPDNVGEALRVVRPWGVDVSSGVESAPGLKDAATIRAFMEAVAGAARVQPARSGS
jgi:phosphoribosylanthranilate isomerase